jgi:hypothetical protein
MIRLLITVFAFLFLMQGCKKDKIRGCTDNLALNYKSDAESDDGSCIYQRNRFLGNYRGVQVCGGVEEPDYLFSVEISPENKNRIQLSGIPLNGAYTLADLKSDPNQFFIPPQLFTSGLDSSNVSGSGFIRGDSLFVEIVRVNAWGVDTCFTRGVKL